MKKYFTVIKTLLLILLISSCNQPKKTTAVKTANKSTEVKTETPGGTAVKPADPNLKTTSGKTDETNGTQIIESAANSLINKLTLIDTQPKAVKDILTGNFLGMGEDLYKKYTMEEAKTIKRDLIKKSSDQILEVLDANQKEKFKSFVQH